MITASDAGGGYLSTRDIILIVVIILAVIGLVVSSFSLSVSGDTFPAEDLAGSHSLD